MIHEGFLDIPGVRPRRAVGLWTLQRGRGKLKAPQGPKHKENPDQQVLGWGILLCPCSACVQTPEGTDGSKKPGTAQPTQLRACQENIATLVVVSIQTLGQANGEIRERLLVGKGPSFGGNENMLIADAVEPPRLISAESSAL